VVRLADLTSCCGPGTRNVPPKVFRLICGRGVCRFCDQHSRALIADFGFCRNDPVYPDLAHSYPVHRISCHRYSDAAVDVVGISPMAYCDPRGWHVHDANAYQNYLHKLASFSQWLLQKQHDVLFFATATPTDDRTIDDLLRIIYTNSRNAYTRRIIHKRLDSVNDVMQQIAQVNLVVASRLHGVLLSHVLGKPVLGISYDQKVDALLRELGQQNYCVDIGTFEVTRLKALFTSMESKLENLTQQIEKKEKEYQQLLEHQYNELFGTVTTAS
jgi:polysaccharide pyruvyl transferase WcaK-like protein